MATHISTFEDLLDYLVQKATPQEILAFRVSEDAQRRAHELMDRNDAGTLTPEERAELDQVLQVERLMAVLKAKAQASLMQSAREQLIVLLESGALNRDLEDHIETLLELTNPEYMASIAEAREDIREGRSITLDELLEGAGLSRDELRDD